MTEGQLGPYRLDGLIGRGGMGEVYRAFDTTHRRTVALKLLAGHLNAQAGYQARFRRESELAARLSEPHVIPIHSFGEIDGQLFIDMRLVAAGAGLGELLARTGALDPQWAVHIVGQVASALDAAHADGLVHRDVKPSNVLVVTSGGDLDFAYLIDFGIARSMAGDDPGLTATGETVGTLTHMAPERFAGAVFDHRVDVYSLGCLLYECLTAVRPFTGQSAPALMYAHLNHPVPRPSAVTPGLPLGLDAVVARAMAKRASDRYCSAGELAAAARAALLPAAPVTPAPVTPVRTTREPDATVPVTPTRAGRAPDTAVPVTPMWVTRVPDAAVPVTPARGSRASDARAPDTAVIPVLSAGPRRSPRAKLLVALGAAVALVVAIVTLVLRHGSQPAVARQTVAQATATCQAAPSRDAAGTPVAFEPRFVLDGDLTTAWACRGDGRNEQLALDFGHPVQISSIAIIPGYAKTDPANGTDRYRQNRRLTEVQYLTDDGTAVTHRLDAAPDHRAEQVIDFGDAVSQRITVRLVSSQPGEPTGGQPASDTVAISELIVLGR